MTNERTDSPLAEHILAVRTGPGANCSSLGSAVDILYAAGVLSASVYAAVVLVLDAKMSDENHVSHDEKNNPSPQNNEETCE